jgi:hypothetical protein
MKETIMITAQDLYDRRDEYGEIDGQELHSIFALVCDGDPSPAGRTPIDPQALTAHAHALRETYAAHKDGGTVGAEYLLDEARFCEAFTR